MTASGALVTTSKPIRLYIGAPDGDGSSTAVS